MTFLCEPGTTLTLVPESSCFPGNFKDIKVLMTISKLLLSTFVDSEQVRVEAAYIHSFTVTKYPPQHR